MAAWVAKEGAFRDPDKDLLDQAVQACEPAAGKSHGALEPLRERLYEVMWDKVGIIRDEAGLRAALGQLNDIEGQLRDTGIASGSRAFNLTWHDWLNLKSLAQVSRVIAEAALARTDLRGAHFREDFPEAGPLEQSAFTSVRLAGQRLEIGMKPVAFTRVRPRESLLRANG